MTYNVHTEFTLMETAHREDDEDMAVLRLCMRSEEDLREYRRRVPWKGEFRYFRSDNVVCIEHHRRPTAPPPPRG
jgi:hypothetical protein